MMRTPPTYNDVVAAEKRLDGFATQTPLLTSPLLNERCGGRIFLKAENLQRTGSFKFRGAMNAITALMEEGKDLRSTGVLACSSGNHAQGIAEAARLRGVKATIIMPHDAPVIKVMRTRRSGADVIFYDRACEDRDVITAENTARLKAELIHPYNHPLVIAGQGTSGLEAANVFEEQGLVPDRVLACTGGGGLSAGIGLVIKEHFPKALFHTVEPIGFDDYKRSLIAGEVLENEKTIGSVCDAILTPSPGGISFSILKDYADEGLTISDEEALSAVAFAFHELKTVVEPGGAAALAALLSGKVDVAGQTILAVLSGGNIDQDMLMRALSEA
ncbi:MAG: threonine/serine dehydratase [Hyphomicrobiales bacterium]